MEKFKSFQELKDALEPLGDGGATGGKVLEIKDKFKALEKEMYPAEEVEKEEEHGS